jgi:ABC-type Fe3+/spermidine/putrescine transport system ATPase subunit
MEVRVENLRKFYGKVEALRSVSLSFVDGGLTAILGPSGCGKTTLLRCIAGFLEPDEGAIYFGRENVAGLPPQKRGTAMVFQNYALWPHMSIFDNVAYGLRLQGVPRDKIRQRVVEVLEMVEMMVAPDILERKPTALSGGQQQRIALARALVVQPKVLLLDEPLSNLDAKVRQRLRVEVRRLQRRVGITTIYVTHDQEEALSMADQVVVMDSGVVRQIGTPEEIYRHPTTAFVAEFLGVTNVLAGRSADGGRAVTVASTTIPVAAPDGEVTVVFKADAAQLLESGSAVDSDAVIFEGELTEVFFVGSTYRHYVAVGGEMMLVDCPHRCTERHVRVAVPRSELKVYPGAPALRSTEGAASAAGEG